MNNRDKVRGLAERYDTIAKQEKELSLAKAEFDKDMQAFVKDLAGQDAGNVNLAHLLLKFEATAND
jgi:hypothetical protein